MKPLRYVRGLSPEPDLHLKPVVSAGDTDISAEHI